MAHTPTTFRTSFPEFVRAPDSLIAAKLAEATRQIDPALWGDKFDDGVGYLAAHKLALSPFGNTAKLTPNTTTTYEIHYRRLLGMVTAGYRST